MVEFIFMLTHHDETVKDAIEVLEEIKDTGVTCVGCKDIGLTVDEYRKLFSRMRGYGIQTFLEVVTYNEEEHFKGVNLALEIGADNLIGGMPWYTRKTLDYIRDRGGELKFFPYIGKVSEHPCVLDGSIEEITKDGKEYGKLGIDGINLLLYRYRGDQKALLNAAVEELNIPLIVAGNVVSFEQIEELKENNVWAFTIGGAIFEKKFVENGGPADQINAVLEKI